MLERQIVTKIEKRLRQEFPGCYLIKLCSPTTSGILDLFFAFRGMAIWLEVKRPNGTVSKIQDWTIRQLLKNGVPAFIVMSPDQAVAAVHMAADNKGIKQLNIDLDLFMSTPGSKKL